MKRFLKWVFAAGFLVPLGALCVQPLEAQEDFSNEIEKRAYRTPPTARELYIGCSLELRDEALAKEQYDGGLFAKIKPYSPGACRGTMGLLLDEIAAAKKARQLPAFCVPNNTSTSTGLRRAMAAVYVDYYEGLGGSPADLSGSATMRSALRAAWPC